MADVIVIGGDPTGLITTPFAAKNGLSTTVFDTDQTWMHKAYLFNYPGIGSVDGSNYVETLRMQVDHFDTEYRQDEEIIGVSESDNEFVVATDDDEYEADYVVLTTGANRDLVESLGYAFGGGLVDVDVAMETSVEDAYATGAMVRVEEWQAVVSTGDGTAAAPDILSKEKGEHCHDFDVPADTESVFGSLIDEA